MKLWNNGGAIDIALQATPACWWDTHKEDLATWDEAQTTMIHRFVPLSANIDQTTGSGKMKIYSLTLPTLINK